MQITMPLFGYVPCDLPTLYWRGYITTHHIMILNEEIHPFQLVDFKLTFKGLWARYLLNRHDSDALVAFFQDDK